MPVAFERGIWFCDLLRYFLFSKTVTTFYHQVYELHVLSWVLMINEHKKYYVEPDTVGESTLYLSTGPTFIGFLDI